MILDVVKQCEALGLENDEEFIRKVEAASSKEEAVALFAEKGIVLPEEDFFKETEDGELTEASLEDVAGGCFRSLSRGIRDAVSGRPPRKKQGLSYWIGYWIGWR